MLYIIGTNRKERRVITATAEEIIENALQQEKEGIEPCQSPAGFPGKSRIF